MRYRILCCFLAVSVLAAAASVAGAQPVITLPAADRPLAVRAPVLYAVGTDDGRPSEAFGSIAGVAFDRDENLYVLDRLNARIVVFDSLGRHRRTIGRRGGGPGEFGQPLSMGLAGDGPLVVADVGHRAFSVFGRDGRFVRRVPFPQGTMPTGGTLAHHPRGGVVSLALGNPASRDPRAFSDEVILRYPLGSGVPDALLPLRTGRERAAAGASARARPAFSPRTHYSLLPSGVLAVATDASYSIRLVDADGRPLREIRRALAPRRVTARDREEERERRAVYSRRGGISIAGMDAQLPAELRAQIARELQDVEFAEVMPVIHALTVDPAGRLWVQRTGPSLDEPGPVDVLSSQGRYLGTVNGLTLPRAFSRRGRIAEIRTDDQGVEHVVVRRLTLPLP